MRAHVSTGTEGTTDHRQPTTDEPSNSEFSPIVTPLTPRGNRNSQSVRWPHHFGGPFYANTLLELFGLANGSGAVTLEGVSAGSSAQLRVTSRTFTTGESGTYGQAVPGVQAEQLEKTLYVLTLRYGSTTRTLALGGRDTEVLADIVSSYNQSSGSGALLVSWDGSTGPVVTSRTYTTSESGGTFGQSIDPMGALRTAMYVPGLRNDSAFRSNIGVVNGGSESESVTLILLYPSGEEVARSTITVAAKTQVQYAVSALFPNVHASAFTLSVQGDANARLFAYGSMVDNASGDPVFFAGQ